MLASRLVGLIRQKVIAHYLGQGGAADALSAAFRIPNLLQNLLGEGVLSAAFIPEYARLRKIGDEEAARRLAGAVLGLLSLAMAVLVAIGVSLTPVLVDLLVPGFAGTRRALAVTLVRILFPGVGLLVLSAWCLGVLNSHRRFFLSYAAPVAWNLAIIAATVLGGRSGIGETTVWIAWGAVIGGVLQFVVQLPTVRRVGGPIGLSLDRRSPALATVARNAGPALLARGVVQISAFLDTWIGSWLPVGAVAALGNAQLLYTLPISLFGMSIAASELPAMAEASAAAGSSALVDRVRRGSAQVAFFVVPTVVLFLVLGGQVAALVFQSGAFTPEDARWVWGTLAAATVGLLPQASGRLLSSAHYALGDTRTPFRFALLRVVTAVATGIPLAFLAPKAIGLDLKWGTAGLSLGAALAATLEWHLLRRSIRGRIGSIGTPIPEHLKLWLAALVAGLTGWLLGRIVGPPWAVAAAAIAGFGAAYLAIAWLLRVPQLAILGLERRR
jgi:putative peptidoglycan lipid II flippase